jgi:hypothetical protein
MEPKPKRFDFSHPQFKHLGIYGESEHAERGYFCIPIDLGLDPEEEKEFEKGHKDNDEDDA